ncbi:HTH binding protein [Mycobacterium phage Gaia]|uniref:HTH binding protein n=1 Tax=Mycobacterium phage Gaia TaxID=1486472 RepID=A0A068F3H1_9CAUD|nr:transcriptional repressor [Mycobacterium phage Gaia]AID58888.1 HTH binding protein [Mycobacterium phage Gaia]AYR00008.1 helix-turn-helix DNA binding protein [Mycobacterium phage Nebkiss]
MPQFIDDPRWSTENVSKIMQHNGIHSPADLAKAIPISRATLYRAFGTNWSGRATERLVEAIAVRFRVPSYLLVKESPCSAPQPTKRPESGKRNRSGSRGDR